MKKIILLLVLFPASVAAFGQQTSFKIEKQRSSIRGKVDDLISQEEFEKRASQVEVTTIKDGRTSDTLINARDEQIVVDSVIKIGGVVVRDSVIAVKRPTVLKFDTKDMREYWRLERIRYSKSKQMLNLEQQIRDNNNTTVPATLDTRPVRETKEAAIAALEEEIKGIEHDQDSLYEEYVKDFLRQKRVTIGFGPVRSRAFFNIVYGSTGHTFRGLTNAGISVGNNSGALYSEIVNGNLGLFRVSFGTMVANAKNDNVEEEKEQEAYQRLVNFGGNTVLNFEYPIAYLHSSTSQYNLIARSISKGAGDIPAFGTNTDKFAGSLSTGLDFYGDASVRAEAGKKPALTFFFNANINVYTGTDVFRDNLGLSDRNFLFGQASLGLIFLESFKLSFIVTTFSSQPNLRNRNLVASGQVLR
ncbi:MAG: hypothetical protein EOO15_06525 [Chitinophagaceae bacterium]|nr:MAG: hypothetical protein EOO15_06525 [Chitinophagaceae bacterium]